VRVEELLFLKKKGDSYAPCRISTAAWQWDRDRLMSPPLPAPTPRCRSGRFKRPSAG